MFLSQIRRFTVPLIFAVWALWLSSASFIRGPLSFVKIHCNADSYVSRLYQYGGLFRSNPLASLEPVMSGTDRMVDYGMPSIFEWAALILPVPLVYVIMLVMQRYIAGYFTYKLLGRLFGARRLWSLIGGLAFALGATRGESIGVEWIHVHFLHEPAFPLLLYCVTFLPLSGWRGFWGWFGLVGLLPALSSQVDIGPFFTLPCAFLFGLIARKDLRQVYSYVRYCVFFAIAGFGFFLYQWPHFAAAFCHLPDASRSHMLLERKTLADAWYLINLKLRYMWIHIGLVVVWLCFFKKKERANWALFILMVFTIVVGTMLRPLCQGYSSHLGMLSSFNFDRLFLYAPFFVVSAAALGLSLMPLPAVKGQISWRKKTWCMDAPVLFAFPIGGLILWLSVASFQSQYVDSLTIGGEGENWHRLYDNPELKALAARIDGEPWRTVTVGAADADDVWQPIFNLAYGLEVADGFKMIYPWRYHQFWRQIVDAAYMETDKNMTRRFMDVDGSRMFLFPSAKTGDDDVVQPLYNLQLLSLANVAYFICDKPINDERLQLLDAAYTEADHRRWLGESLPRKVLGILQSDYLGERLYIYKNPYVFPRFFSVSAVNTFEDEDALLAAMRIADQETLRSTAFVLAEDWQQEDKALSSVERVSLDVSSYKPHVTQLQLQSPEDTLLVMSNTYNPFWRVLCNGKKLRTFPVYHTFTGVIVPAGQNDIHIQYAPPYAKLLERH